MKIEIPITSLEFRDLILILKKYPNGVVKANSNKAFWECELDLTSNPTNTKEPVPPVQPGMKVSGKNNVFSNMADEITNAFGV